MVEIPFIKEYKYIKDIIQIENIKVYKQLVVET
jgi:hypothetical protein